jgi:DHA1 family multidrug resistance protein-like MFS transporter
LKKGENMADLSFRVMVNLLLTTLDFMLKQYNMKKPKVILKNKFLFLSLLLRHIGAAAVWTILPIMIIEKLGGELYHISIIYVANTLTAFILMNVMASKIHLSNVTKFKIGIGFTTFVFVGLSVVTEWWMTMPFMALVGAT